MSNFDTYAVPFTGSAIYGFAITPADGTDLPEKVRAVTINGAGVIAYHDWEGVARTTGTLPAGTYPMLASRILSTGTTATDLTGWV